MATRKECDGYYKILGYDRFSTDIDGDEVLRRLEAYPESIAAHVRRCVGLARTVDVDEYFDISEHATHPDAVSAIITPSESHFPIFLLRPSDNPHYPFALNVIPEGGYTFRKYTSDIRYIITPVETAQFDQKLRYALTSCVSNMPEDLVREIMDKSGGVIIHMQNLDSLDEEFMDVMGNGEGGLYRWINCVFNRAIFKADPPARR